MKRLYIFDLDGTLALIQHRVHLITAPNSDWDAFYEACDKDEPNAPVCETMINLQRAGAEVWIWSGRSDAVREKTVRWLNRHVLIPAWLEMRPSGNSMPDEDLKELWYRRTLFEDAERLVGVFDDRRKVVDRWRAMGVPCFQVANGDF